MSRNCVLVAETSLNTRLTILRLICHMLILRSALDKLAEQDAEKLSDDAILKELKLSSKDVQIEALSGDWI